MILKCEKLMHCLVFAYDTTEHQHYFNCLNSNAAMMPSEEPNLVVQIHGYPIIMPLW